MSRAIGKILKRLALLLLICMSINYVVLVTSIWVFHDKRSLYESMKIGERAHLSLIPDAQFACALHDKDGHSVSCRFGDFWHLYYIETANGVVVAKSYRDVFRPESPRPHFFPWFFTGIVGLPVGSLLVSLWYLFAGSKKITISKWWYTFSLGLSDSPMSLRIRWLVGVTGVISIPVSLLLGFAFGLVIPLLLTVGAVMVGRWKRTGRGIISGAAVFVSAFMIPLAIMLLFGLDHADFVSVAIEVADAAWLLLVISCVVVLVK